MLDRELRFTNINFYRVGKQTEERRWHLSVQQGRVHSNLHGTIRVRFLWLSVENEGGGWNAVSFTYFIYMYKYRYVIWTRTHFICVCVRQVTVRNINLLCPQFGCFFNFDSVYRFLLDAHNLRGHIKNYTETLYKSETILAAVKVKTALRVSLFDLVFIRHSTPW